MQKTNADLIGTRGFQKVQESKKQLSNGIVYCDYFRFLYATSILNIKK